MYKLIAIAISVLLFAQFSWAGEKEDIANITKRIETIIQNKADEPDSIKQTPINGVYEVRFGSEVFYFSGDGRYLLQGSLMDLETNQNLTNTALDTVRKKALAELEESEMIVFSPNKPRHVVTVFTDIDCGYCRKLHREMVELNSYGVAVRYVFFPRGGPTTPSFQKAINVWCAEDQQDAMTKAKLGQSIPKASCENPVEKQYIAGQSMGVSGTPALILGDGSLIPGYRPAKELVEMIDQLVSKK